jgi:hypothetical protein
MPTERASCTARSLGLETGRLAAVLGARKIASRGGQNHVVTSRIVGQIYEDISAAVFGDKPAAP